MMSYLTLMNTNYAYRLKTQAMFDPGQPNVYFDVFVVEHDIRTKEYRLFDNLWRETLLLNYLRDLPDKIAPIVDFGQLPQNIIWRKIEQVHGITLDVYIS